jgi:hypothetical protein
VTNKDSVTFAAWSSAKHIVSEGMTSLRQQRKRSLATALGPRHVHFADSPVNVFEFKSAHFRAT